MVISKLNRKDIDFSIQRYYQELTGVGDPTQKPHRLISTDELKGWEEKEEKVSPEERTGVAYPSF